MQAANEEAPITAINVTPLVDIILVVLIRSEERRVGKECRL